MTTKEEIRKIMEDTMESPYVSRFHRTAMGRALTLFNGLAPNHTADEMREWIRERITEAENYICCGHKYTNGYWNGVLSTCQIFQNKFNEESPLYDPPNWQSYLRFAKEMQHGTDNA